MEAWIAARRPDLKGAEPANGEEMSMTRVGKDMYEKVKIINRSFIKKRNFCSVFLVNWIVFVTFNY